MLEDKSDDLPIGEPVDISDVPVEIQRDEAMEIDRSDFTMKLALDGNLQEDLHLSAELFGSAQNNEDPCPVTSPTVTPSAALPNQSDSTSLDQSDDSVETYAEDDESRPSGTITHRFTGINQYKDMDFSKERKILSEVVKIRCLPWKILVMFRIINNDRPPQRYMGVFLQCNAESESATWSCNARAELRLIAQKEGCEDQWRKIDHNFYAKENDWGFSNFISVTDLFNTDKGFVVDDSIVIQAKVTADAPHGVDWDSKKFTGFVGLKNQGATCYLNSLLQALYFTNKLRKAVFLMPTESDDCTNSVPLALQRVLYELQFSDKAVGTKKLTRSFGWETLDSFMQHDAQELCRVLLDNMESKMKGTSVEDTIPRLFCGRMLSYIKCKHVPYESKREENFYDIQLKVKGNRTIYDAFKEYTAVESMEQENKYDAGEFGLQEAEKGVIFLKFPPVLYLQLMRFQYDYATDTNIKINDLFEFPYKLELDQFLKEPDQESPACYFLHSVLVHSGDNHGGHYVVYLNPRGDNRWYKFDDDVVARCSQREAITLNYGGGLDEEAFVRLCTNAYMLVYIRESAAADVLSPVEESDIPLSLRQRFTEEQRVEEQKRREKADAHLYMSVHFLLEEDFHGWQGYDLCNLELVPNRTIRVPKTASQQELVQIFSDLLRLPSDWVRLWLMRPRKQNNTYRPAVLDMREGYPLRPDYPPTFWVECLSPDSPPTATLRPFDNLKDLLVFLKFYDPITRTVTYVDHLFIRMETPIEAVIADARARVGLAPNDPLLLFEERKPLSVELIPNSGSLIEHCFESLMDGNIIVIQRDLSGSEEPPVTPLTTAVDYFRDYYYQVEVLFADKTRQEDHGFLLTLSSKLAYWDLVREVARYLDTHPELIQLFKVQSTVAVAGNLTRDSGHPFIPVRSSFDGTLKELIAQCTRIRGPKRLYYQRLAISVRELENMRQVRLIYVNSRLVEEQELVVNVSKTALVADLLEEVSKQIQLPPAGSGRLRLLEVCMFRIFQEFPPDTKITQLQFMTNRTLRVEEIPVDELEVGPNETVIHVAHFHKEIFTTFGVPFTLKIRDGEYFSAVRDRIRRKLDVPEKDFEKWRFAVVAGRASYLPDDVGMVVQISIFTPPQVNATLISRPWLGVEHKPSKRPRYNFTEKPIKIHN